MKTVLWATLTANGNYARNTPEHPPKMEALADFGKQIGIAGNFVVGRNTFELNRANGGTVSPGVTIVVVTSNPIDIPGVHSVRSPAEALNVLAAQGHTTALIAGGASLHNAFLEAGLVDELVINVTPVLEDEDLKINLPNGDFKDIELLETHDLGGGITQLRYAIPS